MNAKDLEQVQLQIATTGLGLTKPKQVCPHCGKPVKLVLPDAKAKHASSKTSKKKAAKA